jgi:hypothetical protein
MAQYTCRYFTKTQVYQRIRHGTATEEFKELYKQWTGKRASMVKKESREAKNLRLEKQRLRRHKQLQNETEEEAKLRKRKDRIRQQLRHGSHRMSEDEFEALKHELETLCTYPKRCPDGWWHVEKEDKRKSRRRMEYLRHQKKREQQLKDHEADCLFARGLKVIKRMKYSINQHEAEEDKILKTRTRIIQNRLNRDFPCLSKSKFSHELQIQLEQWPKEYNVEYRRKGYESDVFRKNSVLNGIESRLKLCFRNRVRQTWINTPPPEGEKSACSKIVELYCCDIKKDHDGEEKWKLCKKQITNVIVRWSEDAREWVIDSDSLQGDGFHYEVAENGYLLRIPNGGSHPDKSTCWAVTERC